MLPGRKYTADYILRILWDGRRIILFPLALCTIAGLMVSRTYVDLYRADTLIQIVPQRVPDSYVRSTVTTNIDDRLKSIKQQVMSRTQLEQIISELNLYPKVRADGSMQDAVEQMRLAIQIEPLTDRPGRRRENEQIDAFAIAFTYFDAQMAVKVTERLSSWFIDENSRLREGLAESTNEFLEAQLADARDRLKAQEQRLEQFRQQHSGRLPSQLQSNMQAAQSAQLQLQQMLEATQRDRDRKLYLERMYHDAVAEENQVAAATPPTPPAGQNPGGVTVGGTPRQQLEQAKALLASLQLRLKPDHPDVRRAQRQIAELEAKVQAEAPRDGSPDQPPPLAMTPVEQQRRERVRGMRAEIEQLGRQIAFKEAEERRMRAQVADFQSRIDSVPSLESEWIALSRDYDTLNETYKTLLTKSEESKVAANLERRQIGEQFRILDQARVTGAAVGAQRLQTNAVAVVLGLLIGIGIVGGREVIKSVFHSEADVVGALSMPVLAFVPEVETTEAQQSAKRRHRLMRLVDVAVATLVVATIAVFQLWRYAA